MEIPNEIISSTKEDIWLSDKSIINIRLKPGFEYNESDIERHFEAYSKLGIGINNKTFLLADASVNFVMTPAARSLSAKKAKDYFLAGAIISNSIITMTLINVLTMFYKFKIPLKMFSNERDALVWIEQLRVKELAVLKVYNKKPSVLN